MGSYHALTQRQARSRAHAGADRGVACGAGRGAVTDHGQRLLQPGQRDRLRRCRGRAAAGAQEAVASHARDGALRIRCARTPDDGPGGADGAPAEHTGRASPLQLAQADGGAGVRHHQAGDGLAPDEHARAGQGTRRMELGDHGLEHQAHARTARGVRAKCAPITPKPSPQAAPCALTVSRQSSRALDQRAAVQKNASHQSFGFARTQVRRPPSLTKKPPVTFIRLQMMG